MLDPVTPFDPVRMIFGTEPWLFYAEIVLRSVVIYLYTLLLLRWIGGRSIAQLSLVEFLLVIALGSAVGDALFYPDVPLLHALAAITVVVLLSKGIEQLTLRSDRLNALVDGDPARVVADGVLDLAALAKRNISLAEVKSLLRQQGVSNLGAVRAGYLEPSGHLSVFAADPARPGLRIEPPAELDPLPPAAGTGPAACTTCGLTAPAPAAVCPGCGSTDWTPAT